jgi:putative membrane protein
MILESILAYLHLAAILTLVVFISSEAALCRPEWMNAQVVERLAVVDRVYGIAAGVVLLTGLARIFLGVKGAGWYAHNWLLHAKVGLFIVVGLLSIAPTLRFLRWRKELRATGALPTPEDVRRTRKRVMMQAHLIALIPLAAVFLARGFGGKG